MPKSSTVYVSTLMACAGTPMSVYESIADDQEGPPVAYPHMVGHDPAPDNLAQVSAVLRRLESPNNDLEGFRKGASYAVWQLRELAGDAACREEIVAQGGLGVMIQVCYPSSTHMFALEGPPPPPPPNIHRHARMHDTIVLATCVA